MTGFMFVVVIFVGVLAVAFSLSMTKKMNQAWASVASRFQLVFQQGQLFSRPNLRPRSASQRHRPGRPGDQKESLSLLLREDLSKVDSRQTPPFLEQV